MHLEVSEFKFKCSDRFRTKFDEKRHPRVPLSYTFSTYC